MSCTVVLLCGPPACGKSEIVRSFAGRLAQSTSIVFDEVFTVEEQQEAIHEENGFKNLRKRFLEVGKEVLDRVIGSHSEERATRGETKSTRHLIIVEDNFYLRSMRYKWFQEIRERELSFCTVFFTTPMEDCLQRNQQRARPVPESVIREQFSKLELPNRHEFWEEFSLTKPFPTVEDILALVSAAEKSPFTKLDSEQQSEESEKAREQTKASKLHQIDLAFRKAVSVLMKEAPPADRKTLYARLDAMKSSVISSKEILECTGERIDEQVLADLKRTLQENG